ncbi:MAG: hypothetical protein L3J96_02255, partial [Thermoplasmata archaeon]|nr:hypothetical protein [Thermoplasmata archaeon]
AGPERRKGTRYEHELAAPRPMGGIPDDRLTFFVRAMTRWMLFSLMVGAGAGVTASGFVFGVIASPNDGAVRSTAPWFELVGPGLLILGAVGWGLSAQWTQKWAAALRAPQQRPD